MNEQSYNRLNQHDILNLMKTLFNLGEVKEFFYRFNLDADEVPQPATKTEYIIYLLHQMANRQQEKELVATLREKRPSVEWPETYNILLDNIGEQPKPESINIAQYIEKQFITVNTPIDSSISYRQAHNSKRLNKKKAFEEMANVLYESVFKYSKALACLHLVGLPLIFIIPFMLLYQTYWGFSALIAGGLILGSYKILFSIVFNRIPPAFYYDFNQVSARDEVKSILMQRDWGNKFWNIVCKLMIHLYLKTNKRDANRKKKW